MKFIIPPENSCFFLYEEMQTSTFLIFPFNTFVFELSFEAIPIIELFIITFSISTLEVSPTEIALSPHLLKIPFKMI